MVILDLYLFGISSMPPKTNAPSLIEYQWDDFCR